MQVSEGVALRKLDDANKKISKLEVLALRAEQRADDRENTIYHNRLESRSKAKYLKHTIHVGVIEPSISSIPFTKDDG